jgi:hypothetical protein
MGAVDQRLGVRFVGIKSLDLVVVFMGIVGVTRDIVGQVFVVSKLENELEVDVVEYLLMIFGSERSL